MNTAAVKAQNSFKTFTLMAALTALTKPNQLKVHIRGALANGATVDEIREVLLQVAIYCGVPAAVDSFRIAREVFAEQDKAAAT